MYTVKDLRVVSEVDVFVFLILSCFLHDPLNLNNLISGYSAFSKPSLYFWNLCLHTAEDEPEVF